MLREEKAKLRERLTSEQYEVCVNKGTERPFTGEYWDNHEKGVYHCVVCGSELFSSGTKFDSETGWPSFWEPAKKENLKAKTDRSLLMKRGEVKCSNRGPPLGQWLPDL